MIIRKDSIIGKPEVMVYILTYNHAEYVEQALKSVYSQHTTFDFIVVICDDFSTDGTRSVLEKYYELYGNKTILILNEVNLFSRNKYDATFRNIKNLPHVKYTVVLEGDDYFLPGKLQAQYDVLEGNKDVVSTTHLTKLADEVSGEEMVIPDYRNAIYNMASTRELMYRGIMFGNYFASNSLFFRTKYLYEIDIENDFWNCYANDLATFLFFLMCGKMYCISAVYSVKRRNNANSMSADSNKINIDMEKRIFDIEARMKQLKKFDEISQFEYHVAIANKIQLYEMAILRCKNFERRTYYPGYMGIYYPSKISWIMLSSMHEICNKLFRNIKNKERIDSLFIHVASILIR